MAAAYQIRIAVQRVAKKYRGAPVLYIDDVGEPVDDGNFVTLRLECAGDLATVIVMNHDSFYAALTKVLASAMPGMAHVDLN